MSFAASQPRDRLIIAGPSTIAVNAAETVQLDITMGSEFALLKLLSAECRTANIATIPAYADGERCCIQYRKQSQGLAPPRATSRHPALLGIDADSPADSWVFTWDPQDFIDWPDMQPGDAMRINFPIIDDSGSPTADVRYTMMFRIEKF